MPGHRAATSSFPQHLATEIVYGRSGLRFVVGGFNSDSYPEIEEWLSLGWTEIQDLHHAAFQEAGRSELRQGPFSDQAAITGWFDLPLHFPPQQCWPLRAKLQWLSINLPSFFTDLGKTYLNHPNRQKFLPVWEEGACLLLAFLVFLAACFQSQVLCKRRQQEICGIRQGISAFFCFRRRCLPPSLSAESSAHVLLAHRRRAQSFAPKERPLHQRTPQPSRQERCFHHPTFWAVSIFAGSPNFVGTARSLLHGCVMRSKRYDSFSFGSNQFILSRIETVLVRKRYDSLPVLLLVAMRFDFSRAGKHAQQELNLQLLLCRGGGLHQVLLASDVGQIIRLK